ncbi:UPF0481 protein At3g47200-like [Olea europaea var. sylvestris]|uniref:UPF0481 protein At3g47200-like n=1 Tax=Olea europaea var. sylvestris TaxID=158386 RepID=UPI000C1D7FBD|nr:UPF0481 protein At3g47200-like [Olea europaea var. sylvestris]
MGKSARECYEKVSTEEFDNESFNKMMFLDACFVLYFIIYVFLKTKRTNVKQKEADPLHGWICYLGFVRRDLLLLENQIPLLALKVLMKLLFKSERPDWETELIQNFLDHEAIMPPQENSCDNAVKKFIPQMMGCSVQKKEKRKLDMDAPHLLHLFRKQLIGSSPEDKIKKKSGERLPQPDREPLFPEDKNNEKFAKFYSYRSVTELISAGIHFRSSRTNHVTDVKFKSHLISSTLTLPQIVVDDSTKDLLLNLAAYEMCPHSLSDYHIMSYICLMDSFIDHADDVKELRKRRILVNNLGSDEELAQLFNEIANDLVFDRFAYADVKSQIQNHCDSNAQVWMAEWIHNHFSSPWAFLAFLGVISVIALTVVQTYFTVFPHQTSGHKTS